VKELEGRGESIRKNNEILLKTVGNRRDKSAEDALAQERKEGVAAGIGKIGLGGF
jgi:hypothetical protein